MTDSLDLSYETDVPDDLVDRAFTRAGQIRRRRRQAAAAGAVLTVGLVGAGVPLALHGSSARTRTNGPATAASAVTGPTTAVSMPAGVPTPEPSAGAGLVGGLVRAPATWVAFTGAGGEVPTVVRTDGGAPVRTLGPGAQVLGSLTADGATLYLPRTKNGVSTGGCGDDWDAIDVATGAAHPVLAGVRGVVGLVPGPGGAFAYRRDECLTGKRMSEAGSTIVLRAADGSERSVVVPGIVWLDGFDASGSRLIAHDTAAGGLRVITTATLAVGTIAAPSGCEYGAAQFVDASTILAAQTCGGAWGNDAHVSLVELTSEGDAAISEPVDVGGKGFTALGLSLDPSGQHALVVLSNATQGAPDGQVYEADRAADGAFTAHATGTNDTFEALW